MMKVAIMQPYLFPYIGYFNLIYHADIFVLYNDVNYIERGWINKNRIIARSGSHEFTLPLQKASSSKLINEIYLAQKERWGKKFLKTIEMTYRKTPFFEKVYAILKKIIENKIEKLDLFIEDALKSILSYLEIERRIVLSSDLDYNRDLDKVGKIQSIATLLEASEVAFPKGSKSLYSQKMFENEPFKTTVVEPLLLPYQQFKSNLFTEGLSILDVLMFNSKEELQRQLSQYNLTTLHEKL